MSYGFVIDNRKCIGCHACSTACKSENEVPLGVFRTWVKYTEKGSFPDTRRYFQVTRCNHCDNPPCVRICPVSAMYQRKDGIVDFDPLRCIGCKACLQACPYDAIYIDPVSNTAAKCHFCAHRTDVGLEPACVVVCPVHAIIAGDLHDPKSEIARLVATQEVKVRKPEQNTRPKLFYIDGEESSIVPAAAAQSELGMWSSAPAHGDDWRGPIHIGAGRMAGEILALGGAAPRETYNVAHKIPWHWQVPAYMLSKSIGAGAFIVAALGRLLGLVPDAPLFTAGAGAIGLAFVLLSMVLLVWDLDRPERFWMILARPQWRSWLTRGSFVLLGFVLLSGLDLALRLAGVSSSGVILWPGLAFAILTAIYTAFLMAQAEGRDLWQSPILPVHMLAQAGVAGSAALLIAVPWASIDPGALMMLSRAFAVSLIADLFITATSELMLPHTSQTAAIAAHLITHGRYKPWFWTHIAAGLVVPLILVLWPGIPVAGLALAGALSWVGLFAYDWALVMAPQDVPNN